MSIVFDIGTLAGARAAGLQAIPFPGAEDLRHSLTRRGLL